MKVQLVHPQPHYGQPRNGGAVPHLGLWVLASHIRQQLPQLHVEVLDGRTTSQDDLARRLDADVVGFSATLYNYPHCLELAQEAKGRGARVIMGGIHATAVCVNILRNRPHVDAVVIGDGERALERLLQGSELETIENVVVRSGDGWESPNATDRSGLPKPVFYSPSDLPRVEFDREHVQALVAAAMKQGVLPEDVMLPSLSHKGCSYRGARRCYFCSIRSAPLSFVRPAAFWDQVCLHVRQHGIRRFHDVGDSIGGSRRAPRSADDIGDGLIWLRAAAAARPDEAQNVELLMYVRPDDLARPGYADALDAVGARTLYVGFESNSAQSLAAFRKGTIPEDNERALETLDKCGFQLYATFILGAPGETDQSLDETRKFAHRVRRILGDRAKMLGANIMIAYPGVPAFAELAKARPDLLTADLLDPNDLTRAWVEHACNLSGPRSRWWDKLVDACEEIGSLTGDTVKLYDHASAGATGAAATDPVRAVGDAL